MVISMSFLALAVRDPVGTGYAVWTGIGPVGTAILGIVLFSEPVTAARDLPVVDCRRDRLSFRLIASGFGLVVSDGLTSSFISRPLPQARNETTDPIPALRLRFGLRCSDVRRPTVAENDRTPCCARGQAESAGSARPGGIISGEDRIRTCDLEVMSLASYRAAPPRDIGAGETALSLTSGVSYHFIIFSAKVEPRTTVFRRRCPARSP